MGTVFYSAWVQSKIVTMLLEMLEREKETLKKNQRLFKGGYKDFVLLSEIKPYHVIHTFSAVTLYYAESTSKENEVGYVFTKATRRVSDTFIAYDYERLVLNNQMLEKDFLVIKPSMDFCGMSLEKGVMNSYEMAKFNFDNLLFRVEFGDFEYKIQEGLKAFIVSNELYLSKYFIKLHI